MKTSSRDYRAHAHRGRDLLIIMARYPTRGKVKTRLAAEIGHRAASDLYRSFLTHFVREFARAPFAVEWRYTPARSPFRRIIGRNGYRAQPQPDGDLGARMRCIFEESFACGYKRIVMIGTDAPELGQGIVKRAFQMLGKKPAVFQPTYDGGYALIGLSAMLDVFSGVSWSTPKVMAQTRARLNTFGIAFAELPSTFDVDTAADMTRLRAGRGRGRTAALLRLRRGR
jgi:rSAM/selenodomain-associated transferase 1